MPRRSSDRRSATPDAARSDRRSLRLLHGTIAYLTMLVGLPLALVGTMAAFGGVSANLWVRLALAGVGVLVIPMILADRLLPKDPAARKPGLVRDVFAGTWAAAAIACLALAEPVTAAPLEREAARLDEHGLTRAAYLAAWMAGPAQTEAETEVTLASAELETRPPAGPEPRPSPADASSPAPTPAPADADEAASDEDGEDEAPSSSDTEASATPAAAPNADPSEPASGPPPELSPAELFSTYAPSVVSIKVGHHGYRSGGTGFIIDARGTIATNHHVIEDASEVQIKTLDGVEIDRVELLASDPEVDLALLRVDPEQLGDHSGPVRLGDSESVEVGEPVSVIGNPLGLEHTLTNGIVSARRVYEGKRYIQMSAPISPGNSGGPVFDHRGRVIAISVATMFGGQNLNLAVPVSQLEAMVADDYPKRRSFGASSW